MPVHGKRFGVPLCAALGLEPTRVRRIDLHVAVDDIVTAEVELYPTEQEAETAVALVKRYQLVEIAEDHDGRA